MLDLVEPSPPNCWFSSYAKVYMLNECMLFCFVCQYDAVILIFDKIIEDSCMYSVSQVGVL